MARRPNTWSVITMIEFIKKFCTYFAATVTFLIALKASFGVATTWKLLVVLPLAAGVVCAAIAWMEVRRKTSELPVKASDDTDAASISLAVKRALSAARFAPRNDESIAFQANKIVRRGLDKHCIKYKDYQKWRRKNPAVFTAVTDSDNQLLGFFDIFPLTDQAARGLIEGHLDEHSLTVESILPDDQNESAKKIYIASIMTNPKQKAYSGIVVKEVILLKFLEFLTTVFPPNDERILFAYAHTDLGERLLKHGEFRNTALSNDNKQGDPLYELAPDGYKTLAKTFNAISGARVPSTKRNRGRTTA